MTPEERDDVRNLLAHLTADDVARNAEEDELLPHVVLCFDPELADPDRPWLGAGSFVTGPYPDRMAALAAAVASDARLNAGAAVDDLPFVSIPLAIHPVSYDEVPSERARRWPRQLAGALVAFVLVGLMSAYGAEQNGETGGMVVALGVIFGTIAAAVFLMASSREAP